MLSQLPAYPLGKVSWHFEDPDAGDSCVPRLWYTVRRASSTYITVTIRLQLNPDFDRGFPRSEFLMLTNMHMYKHFGARKYSIEIGAELQS